MKTFDQLIDVLTYSSYKANRGYSPDITPEDWQKIYPKDSVALMEERYQSEIHSIEPTDQILMTVAEFEDAQQKKFDAGYEYGKRDAEKEAGNLRNSHTMASDRFNSAFPEILERLKIDPARSEVRA